MRRAAVILAAVLLATPVQAQDSVSPEVEARARVVGKQLRCVVCQNQSIEESDAELAVDMRRVVRERLAEGDTEAEVIAMMADRYGDFVLLRPPVQANTLLLWAGPIVLGLGALLGWLALTRRPATASAAAPLSDEERARLEALRDAK